MPRNNWRAYPSPRPMPANAPIVDLHSRASSPKNGKQPSPLGDAGDAGDAVILVILVML